MRPGRAAGLELRGNGRVAASAAACHSVSRSGDTPKYARLAAATPQIPGPHSTTFKYSSRIRSLDSARSKRSAVTASLSLRSGLRDGER